eukprot:6194871-Pleurochrysis_carterae.AAC.1
MVSARVRVRNRGPAHMASSGLVPKIWLGHSLPLCGLRHRSTRQNAVKFVRTQGGWREDRLGTYVEYITGSS